MTGILETVNRRTNLVGQNRMELLLFKLKDQQLYGINVFKIREVTQCPKLRSVPHSHEHVRGIFDFRDHPIMAIDLSASMGGEPLDPNESLLIVTEYNQTVQGLLIRDVEKIINLSWDQVEPPPAGIHASYLTAVAKEEDYMIEILDVEQVLWTIAPKEMTLEKEHDYKIFSGKKALILDDSRLARQHLQEILETVGIEVQGFTNGKEALDFIDEFLEEHPGEMLRSHFAFIISDIEMPLLDGYTFCHEIKKDNRCKNTPVILHTSLSGHFNDTLVKQVQADYFVKKFDPDEIISSIEGAMRKS